MRKSFFLIALFLLPAAYALSIDLSIQELFLVNATYFHYNDTGAVKAFGIELLNTGSISYSAQARLDIYEGDERVFTAWSRDMGMAPGLNAYTQLYWVPEKDGNYKAKLRIYYGGEMLDKEKNITVTKQGQEGRFEVKSAKAYSSFMIVELANSSGKMTVIPDSYPRGWQITQAQAKNGKAVLKYSHAALPQPITLVIADEERYARKEVTIERATGFDAMIKEIAFAVMSGR